MPTKQLLAGKVNGERIITGNNGNEGTYFVSQNITTQKSFEDFLRYNYPRVSDDDVKAILGLYGISEKDIPPTKFDTDGINPPYATIVSGYATGWQQAANNLYAETTFVCPAYWLADAYSSGAKTSWRYQFSIPNAFHGADIAPISDSPDISDARMDPTFRRGFQSIWGRFITTGDPTLPEGGYGGAAWRAAGKDSWGAWGVASKGKERFDMLNLNVTSSGAAPGQVKADWKVVDGNKFEGDRGARCDLWVKLGGVIEE